MTFILYIHSLSDVLVGNIFSHNHLWYHVIIHITVIFVPMAFATIFISWFIKLYQQYKQAKTPLQAKAQSDTTNSLDANFIHFFLRHTKSAQIRLVILALASLPIFYASLELPKALINQAINGENFPVEYFGFSFEKIELLIFLSILLLIAIMCNGCSKYLVNIKQATLAERMVRRLRLTIYRQWQGSSSKSEPANISPLITQEVEPIGGFAAELIVTPVLQGGTFITILTFFFLQSPILAAAAITLVPLQLYIIPKLQQRVNTLARDRVREVRALSVAVASNQTAKTVQLQSVLRSVKRIQNIRFMLHRRKFFMKSLNNFLSNMTPFFFYSIGGALVIDDKISLGALVAAISAYKEFASPFKELLNYYQHYEDVRVRYGEMRDFLLSPIGSYTNKASGAKKV